MWRQFLHNMVGGVQYGVQQQGQCRQGGLAMGIVHISSGSKAFKGMLLEISLYEYWGHEEHLRSTHTISPSCYVPANGREDFPYAIQIPTNARLSYFPKKDHDYYSEQGWFLKVRLRRPILDIVIKEKLDVTVAAPIDALIQFCKECHGMRMLKEPKWDKKTRLTSFKMSPPKTLTYEINAVDFTLCTNNGHLDGTAKLLMTNKKLTDYMKTAVGLRNRLEQPIHMSPNILLLEDEQPNFEAIGHHLNFEMLTSLEAPQGDGRLSLADEVNGEGKLSLAEGHRSED